MRRAEIVSEQTVGGKSVLAVADGPVPGVTAWTAASDVFAETAVGITVLGLLAL